MKRVISTHVSVNHRLTTAWLGKVERAGIAAVEIFCAPQHIDYRNKSQISELGHWFRDSELKLHSLHSPMYTDEIWGRSGPHAHINITERTKGDRIRWVDEIRRALEVAETIPFRYLIQHLGVGGQEYSEHAVEAAFSSLDELTVFARQRGVEILLENTPNELSTAERLRLFNEVTHLNLNYVFDTGHAHLGAGIEHEFGIMQDRIRSLHVHDNDGKEDQHLFPLSERGTIDWKKTMTLLRAKQDQYPLLLELREVNDMPDPLGEVVRVFDRLESL
ncbi:MAG TPA: sugar phosphate isomerase/epimerase family protein [Bryobacteraceae bacterium]|nr:sugar phosphate isomerase/epimerase family protein [Bryobacteraceae bacterium]